MADYIREPPWTTGLPRLSTATKQRPAAHLRLPASLASFPGEVTADPVRGLALGLRRRCASCGCHILGGVYNVFVSSPDSPDMRHGTAYAGDVYTSNIPGPKHRSCALHAALICPFLRYSISRKRHEPCKGARRGNAAVVGFRRFGIAYFTEPVGRYPELWTYFHQFGYADMIERIPFGSAKELLPLYEKAVADDAKRIDISTRLHWTDSYKDTRDLAQCEQLDRLRLATMQSSALTQINGYGYRLAWV